jgi:hypothetical protein
VSLTNLIRTQVILSRKRVQSLELEILEESGSIHSLSTMYNSDVSSFSIQKTYVVDLNKCLQKRGGVWYQD